MGTSFLTKQIWRGLSLLISKRSLQVFPQDPFLKLFTMFMKWSPRKWITYVGKFTQEEVKKALFQMNPTKVLGPDGMNPFIFSKILAYCWNWCIWCCSWLHKFRKILAKHQFHTYHFDPKKEKSRTHVSFPPH